MPRGRLVLPHLSGVAAQGNSAAASAESSCPHFTGLPLGNHEPSPISIPHGGPFTCTGNIRSPSLPPLDSLAKSLSGLRSASSYFLSPYRDKAGIK